MLDYALTNKLSSVETKQNWILDLSNHKVDYVVVGSSKSELGADIKNIQKISGLEGINLSSSGCGIKEQYLLLKKFLQNNSTKYVYLMVDFTTLDPSQFTYAFHDYLYLHRINDSDIAEIIKSNMPCNKYLIWKYIPFIRFAEFNSEIKRLICDEINSKAWDEYGFCKPVIKDIDFNKHKINMFDIQGKGTKNVVSKELKINASAEKDLLNIIDLTKRNNIKLIMVSFPENTLVSPEFELSTRNLIRTYFHELANTKSIKYLDFTTLNILKHDNYYTNDDVHLNQNGLKIFSPIFADSIKKYARK
jgi:hypothetical protein